jgi:hypothetical protein
MKKEIVRKTREIEEIVSRTHSEETEINYRNHFGISLAL